MIIKYGNKDFLRKREKKAEEIFMNLPYRYCFITGSFLYKKSYNDIDVFVITRSKKKAKINDKKVNIQFIDFNDLHSLFFHSISKSCIAKNILPKKRLRVTLSDYWGVINEAVPTIFNEKRRFKKYVRDLVLYTEYFRVGKILSSKELNNKISFFNNYEQVIEYVTHNALNIFKEKAKLSYIKRFFYTESANYKSLLHYDSHRLLYLLSHKIINEATT